jgi:hypothetical protein
MKQLFSNQERKSGYYLSLTAPSRSEKLMKNSSVTILHGTTLLGQLGEKNISTTLSSRLLTTACHARGLIAALVQFIGNARGLNINSTRSAEDHPQDLRYRRHQQRDDPNNARGLDNNFASDRDCDSTTTTRLCHRRLRRANHAAPDKS